MQGANVIALECSASSAKKIITLHIFIEKYGFLVSAKKYQQFILQKCLLKSLTSFCRNVATHTPCQR